MSFKNLILQAEKNSSYHNIVKGTLNTIAGRYGEEVFP